MKPTHKIVIETDNDQLISDTINPDHYKQGEIECIDALKAATVFKVGIEAVCVANIIKYLWRYEFKGGIDDIYKARWYLNKLIEEVKKDGYPGKES